MLKKTIQKDLDTFTYWLKKHIKNNPPFSLIIFTGLEVKKVN